MLVYLGRIGLDYEEERFVFGNLSLLTELEAPSVSLAFPVQIRFEAITHSILNDTGTLMMVFTNSREGKRSHPHASDDDHQRVAVYPAGR